MVVEMLHIQHTLMIVIGLLSHTHRATPWPNWCLMLTHRPQVDDRHIDHAWPALTSYEVSTSALASRLCANEKIQRACLCHSACEVATVCVCACACLSCCCDIPPLNVRSWRSKLCFDFLCCADFSSNLMLVHWGSLFFLVVFTNSSTSH